MAIWEQPNLLSGTIPPTIGQDGIKAEVGLCIIHTGTVSTEWAFRLKLLQIPPFVYVLNRNQPYDTAREQCTRGVLQHGVEWVFHLDTDVLIPIDAIPKMIEFSKKFDLPVLSGLYWAKKPNYDDKGNIIPPMPAAWVKYGDFDSIGNKYNFAPIDAKEFLGKGTLVPVDVIGAGCMLVRADIFKKLDESNPKKPYFEWGLGRKDENTGKPLLQLSEDFYFCMRLINELNIHPHVCFNVVCDHEAYVYRRGEDGQFQLSTRM